MLIMPWLPMRANMKLKFERNGRIWNNKGKPEEVLDVFYGENFKEKVSRGVCLGAFKEIIKQEIRKGEALFIRLEIQG
jgi:hypothetical protein